MNRRQFFPLLGLPALVPLLPNPKQDKNTINETVNEYILDWSQIATNRDQDPRFIYSCEEALKEIERVGARVVSVVNETYVDRIHAERIYPDFLTADQFKRSRARGATG